MQHGTVVHSRLVLCHSFWNSVTSNARGRIPEGKNEYYGIMEGSMSTMTDFLLYLGDAKAVLSAVTAFIIVGIALTYMNFLRQKVSLGGPSTDPS